VLAGRPGFAFVDIFGAVDSFVAVRAGTHVGTVDGTSITNGSGVTRVGSAGIVQMAQQSGFAWSALAKEAADSIVTSGAIEASGASAIINIL